MTGAQVKYQLVTVTTGKVTVTSALRHQITLQAGMYNAISDVRRYVGPEVGKASYPRRRAREKTGKSEKYP
jgi:hypothetical protein